MYILIGGDVKNRMQKKKLKKIIAVSGVVGAMLSAKTIPVNATTINNSGIAVASVSKGQVVNVTSTLRVRSAANTNSTVLGTLRNGSTFDIISKSGSWYEINYNGGSGFVHEDYVKEITESSTVSATGKVVNVTSNLRVRSGASTSASVLGYITNNTSVSIVGVEGSWYKIKYNSGYGYVHKDYISVDGSSSDNTNNNASNGNNNSSETVINKTGYVYNVSSGLNVRSAASTSSTILGTLYSGSSVNIIGESGSWYKIKYNSGYGYVHKDYISVDGSSSDNTNNNASNGSNNSSETVINKIGYVYNVSSGLNVRSEASTSSTILGTLYSGSSVNIIGESGSWYKITYNSSTAYVHKDYITENKPSSGSDNNSSTSNDSVSNGNSSSSEAMNETGVVVNVSSNLRVRKEASSSSLVLGYLLNNQTVTITGKEGNWYKINFNGSTGYVSADYVKITTGTTNNGGSTGNNSGTESVSSSYEIVLEALKSQIGSPYAYGAAGELVTRASIDSLKGRFPSDAAQGKYDALEQYVDSGLRAFDCSGLMQWGFAKANINIGRTTYDQINAGVEVSINNIQPGDLLFDSNLGHVAMYIGNGQWIESPSTGKTVRITDVRWDSATRARRVF